MADEPQSATPPAAEPTPASPETSSTSNTPEGVQTPAANEPPPSSEGTKSEGQEPPKPESPPEKYEFKTPEGSNLDPAVIEQYSEVAKELGLSQENAQKVIDKIAPALAQRQTESLQAAQSAWLESTKADKEVGGEKLEQNLAVAQKALNTFGTPELKSLLNDSRLGDHPEVARLLYRVGLAISEDKLVTGNQPVTGSQSPMDAALSKLYPSQK